MIKIILDLLLSRNKYYRYYLIYKSISTAISSANKEIKEKRSMTKLPKKDFNKSAYPWKATVNYRKSPHLYRVGRGEQGVLICEPYKSEILPLWKFKSVKDANISSKNILKLFHQYVKLDDFVGADLARKFLQMGYTRARRYANYKGGTKYDHSKNGELLPRGTGEIEKAKSAEIFYKAWKKAEAVAKYTNAKKQWKEKYG